MVVQDIFIMIRLIISNLHIFECIPLIRELLYIPILLINGLPIHLRGVGLSSTIFTNPEYVLSSRTLSLTLSGFRLQRVTAGNCEGCSVMYYKALVN